MRSSPKSINFGCNFVSLSKAACNSELELSIGKTALRD